MAVDPIRDYILTDHAAVEMGRRRLQEKNVDTVPRKSWATIGCEARSSHLAVQYVEGNAEYSLRVFVDIAARLQKW